MRKNKKWTLPLYIGLIVLFFIVLFFAVPQLIRRRNTTIYPIWYLTEDGNLASKDVRFSFSTGMASSVVTNMASKMMLSPADQPLHSVFPTDVKLISATMEEFTLTMNFSKEINDMSSRDLSLAYCCAVKTFFGVNGIDRVLFRSGDQNIGSFNGYTWSDFLVSPDDTLTKTADCVIYAPSGNRLIHHTDEITYYGYEFAGEKLLKKTADYFEQIGLSFPLRYQHYSQSDDVAYVDLSYMVSDYFDENSVNAALYITAIVNSLTSLDDVNTVYITIDGVAGTVGTLDLTKPISFNSHY